jgi:hypothetical protein
VQPIHLHGAAAELRLPITVPKLANVVPDDALAVSVTEALAVVHKGGGLLTRTNFAQNANAPVVQLACVSNAGSYDGAAISDGELVSLFGQELGPAEGTQPQVTLESGFPNQLAGVQVTFNSTPGPLLYVQDGQLNAIALWALQNQTGQTVNVCVVYNRREVRLRKAVRREEFGPALIISSANTAPILLLPAPRIPNIANMLVMASRGREALAVRNRDVHSA